MQDTKISEFASIMKGTDWNLSEAVQKYGQPVDIITGEDGTTTYGYICPKQGHFVVTTDKDGKVKTAWSHQYSEIWSPIPGDVIEYSRSDKPGSVMFGVFVGSYTVGTATFIGVRSIFSYTDETEYKASNAVIYVNPMYVTMLCPINTQRALSEENTLFNKGLEEDRKRAAEMVSKKTEEPQETENNQPQ